MWNTLWLSIFWLAPRCGIAAGTDGFWHFCWEWLIGGKPTGYHVKLPWILPFWINYSDLFCNPGLKWSFSKISREYRSFPFQSFFTSHSICSLFFRLRESADRTLRHWFVHPNRRCLPIPYAPCMEYLPTFTPQMAQMYPNVGKYTIHGAYGNTTSVVFHSHSLIKIRLWLLGVLPSLFGLWVLIFGKRTGWDVTELPWYQPILVAHKNNGFWDVVPRKATINLEYFIGRRGT